MRIPCIKNPIKTTGLHFLPILAIVAGLVACASVPPAPTESIQAADTAIHEAEQARVADYASAELTSARQKLIDARALVETATKEKDEKKMQKARDMADEARADAEVATAKAQQVRAEGVNKEMQQNIDTLQQEIQRKSRN